MLFDTHTHIYLSEKKSEKEIIEDIENDSILSHIVTIGTDLKSSAHNLELSKNYPFILAAISIHPCYIEEYIWNMEASIQQLEDMILQWTIVAIGEIGLDYYRLPPRLQDTPLTAEEIQTYQKRFFIAQIRLAKKYSLPIIIHNREAKDDVLEILQNEDCKDFVIHCYSEDLEYAQRLIAFSPNCKISFSGTVTFKSAPNLQETAANIPLWNILIETDCPYLSPVPERWTENYPSKVKYVLRKIQELRNEWAQEIEETIYQNSLNFFKVK